MEALRGVDRRVAAGCAALGGVLGVLLLWLLQPEPAPCTTTSSGLRACMPVVVVTSPPWAYLVFAAVGALLGLLAAVAVLAAWRRVRPPATGRPRDRISG